MFRFMLTFEITDCILASIVALNAMFKCGSFCSFEFGFITKIFQLIITNYLANAIHQFQAFLGIAFERLQAFATENKFKMKFRNQLAIMITVAGLITLPNYLVTRTILPFAILSGTNQTLFKISVNTFAQTQYWSIFLFGLVLVRTLFLYIVIIAMNITVIYRYKEFMFKKVQIL